VLRLEAFTTARPQARHDQPGTSSFARYLESTWAAVTAVDLDAIQRLAVALRSAWAEQRQVFVCGNGGSAANAIHIANDLLFGIAGTSGRGLRVQALSANQAVLTCLANDLAYDAVFSKQLELSGREGDLLVALSGSGNSRNVVRAIDTARRLGMTSHAILGYSGGDCLERADHVIHLAVDDMQISEDFQLMVGHMVMQWLKAHPPAA
jgi:D-sedoheptulose 7-phosphate isomerase